MSELSRRNFLKGIMAAAGVAAVGLPAAEVHAAPALPEDRSPTLLEHGDVWVGDADNPLRFVGKSTRIEIINETIDIPTFGDPGRRSLTGRYDARITMISDHDGENFVVADGMRPKVFWFGLPQGQISMPGIVTRSQMRTVKYQRRLMGPVVNALELELDISPQGDTRWWPA